MRTFSEEVGRGRTFAIISHPDAGKTTLTEKLLLFGGAIREAGAVKARRAEAHARSDWMEIERRRGISVTSTVLRFDYAGYRINLLDTPGHQDFSEDTYRTLLAADSVVMVIDAAKGIEPQTLKLFEVAKASRLPVFTFINKLDREGRDPWDLLEEIDRTLGIGTYPVNWPVGMGLDFRGIWDRKARQFERFDRDTRRLVREAGTGSSDLPDDLERQLTEALAILDGAGEPLDPERVARGEQSPVFFGSALANFGVENFLHHFLALASGPRPRATAEGTVDPSEPGFSGFVFKIQANMNPAHRDRVAFVRVCSGRFVRGMTVVHGRTGRRIRLNQPQQFLAAERSILEEAFPGDVIGLHDTGLFHIGDTLSEFPMPDFTGIPRFSPEHFAEVELKQTSKHKAYQRGLAELGEEGLLQIFRPVDLGPQIFLGVVGPLQFEVLEYRLAQEYGVDVELHPLPYGVARWIAEEDMPELGRFDRARPVRDARGRLVLLVDDERTWTRLVEKNPRLLTASRSAW